MGKRRFALVSGGMVGVLPGGTPWLPFRVDDFLSQG
jgi:hypothetical protein